MVSQPRMHGVVPGNMPGKFQTPRNGINIEQSIEQKPCVLVLELNFAN